LAECWVVWRGVRIMMFLVVLAGVSDFNGGDWNGWSRYASLKIRKNWGIIFSRD